MSLIEIVDLTQRHGSKTTLSSISLSIEKSEILAIIGPTGAGKTTLLRLIDQIDTPASGKVLFDGIEVTRRLRTNVRRQISMVLQKPVVFDASVYDNVAYPLKVRKYDRKNIPVYSADPLLDSAARLFGTNEKRRFPLLPGSHVICAAKEYAAPGPKYIWSAIAISIAEDRAADSCLFIEDAGEASVKDAADLNAFGDGLLHKIAKCAIRCGEDNNALYKEIWISYRIKWIPEGQVGCALVAAPYLVLAKKAIPDGKPEGLLKMTISDWEKKISLAE